MENNASIGKLFYDLYEGNPWLEVNLRQTLSEISNEVAVKKISDLNSIWEIVNHIIAWRENVLKRVQGEVLKTPNHNYFIKIEDISVQAWKETLHKLEASQKKWMDFLKQETAVNFNSKYPVNEMSYYDHIHGILQHDAYHLGQIKLLLRMMG